MKTQRIEEGSSDREASRPTTSWIVRIGCAGAPLDPPDVVSLDGVVRLVLGRRDEEPSDGPGRFECRDSWMSKEHAELSATDEGHLLSDLGSSNGTLVWGQRASSFHLVDGDLFETGGTFWLYRSRPLSAPLPAQPAADVLGSLHPDMIEVARRLERFAKSKVPVLFLGATGTGKEVLARRLHALSGREGPFLAINTGAVQANLVASELFGVEKGAHSTADRSRPGLIRSAEGGTLLLDEIGDMPLEVQISLLRALQESEVVPVGGDRPLKVDVRFVGATHQDLPAMVKAGSFRADLYARLKGTVVELPELAERLEDIGLLIARFLERWKRNDLVFSPAAYRALLVYPWPLNVRELERTVEAAAAVCDGARIEIEHLPTDVAEHAPPSPSTARPDEEERSRELLRLLRLHHGNVSAVARTMGKSRMQIHRWLKELGVSPAEFRV